MYMEFLVFYLIMGTKSHRSNEYEAPQGGIEKVQLTKSDVLATGVSPGEAVDL